MSGNQRAQYWALGVALAVVSGCAGSPSADDNAMLAGSGGVISGSGGSFGAAGMIGGTGGKIGGVAGMVGGAAGAVSGGAGVVASTGGTGAAGMTVADAGKSDGGIVIDPGGGNFIREAAPTSDSASTAGSFMVENYTMGYPQSADYADSTIYYPVDADPPFAYVSVVPGFVSPQSAIQNWGPFLASHGIVAITIGTNSPTDSPDVRAAALIGALATLASENAREGSPLKGHIALDHKAVAGWSMGGGGTLIAAAANPDLKAAVSFAAWGPTGGEMNKVPALMFEATADPLAAGMSDGFYAATADSTPKMLFEVNGAGHDVANDPANSGGVIGRYGLSWFKVFLEGDERYKQFLLEMPTITSNWETNVK